MKLSIICFSLTGLETAEKLKMAFQKKAEIRLARKSRYLPDEEPMSTDEWTRLQFDWADGILFVGACAIAVRHIAPYIRSKKTDPAVLAVDECGKFVISLLSGHLGGANELAQEAAQILGAIPVVTTATDLHHCFAVDVFARKNNCKLLNLQAAKQVSAALLAGREVGFYSDFPFDGRLPKGLVPCDSSGRAVTADPVRPFQVGVAVTIDRACRPFDRTAVVVPKAVVLGMGCRRGKDTEAIQAAARQAAECCRIYLQAIAKITSIDLKKEEPGLCSLARQWKIPFETYSEEELWKAEGEFSASDFVKTVIGVDNVCERSAVLGSGHGRLIQKKIGRDGVTAALAIAEWRMDFE